METEVIKLEENNSINLNEQDSDEDAEMKFDDTIMTIDTGRKEKFEEYNFSDDTDDEIEKAKYPVVDEEMLKWDLDKFLVPKEKKMPSKQKNDWDYDIDTIKEHVNLTKKISAENELINGSTMPEYKPFFYETNRQRIKRNKMIRDKSAGKNWFNMEAPEITQEIKNDLQILKMRSAIDSKHFYKRNDQKGLLKFFQVGQVVDSPLDYYSSRLTKKERKRTLVDELMANAEFKKNNKKRYKEIIEERKNSHYRAHKRAKKLKKNKK